MTDANHLTAWHRRALSAHVPLSAYLELTHRCNLDCGFCCNRQPVDADPLDLETWVDALDQLRRLGTLYVNLTGGEPLVHPRWREIIAAARRRAFAVRLLTNATLIDEESAATIAAAQPLSVETTIHGATAEIHDRTTRHPGSFDATWRGIDLMRKSGINVVLKTVTTRVNRHQIDQIAELAEELGLPLRIDEQILPRDDGDPGPLEWSTSKTPAQSFPEDSQPEPSAGSARCGLGRSTLTIDPSGQVFPCILWRESVYGNLREAPLDTIWRRPLRRRLAALAVVTPNQTSRNTNDSSDVRGCPAATRRMAGHNGLGPESSERRVAG